MSAPEHPVTDHTPAPDHRRRNATVLAVAGAVAGVSALFMGQAARKRLQAGGADPFNEETGRGEPSVPPSPQAVRRGFETEDMSAVTMGLLAAGLAIAIAVAVWLMVLMLHGFRADREQAPPLTAEQQAPIVTPLPHLQDHPLRDIAALRRTEADRLNHYAWADPQHTRARIPIGEAMQRTIGQSLDGVP